MKNKTNIKEIVDANEVEINGIWVVIAEAFVSGERFKHNSQWSNREDAGRLTYQVLERGKINLDHWSTMGGTET